MRQVAPGDKVTHVGELAGADERAVLWIPGDGDAPILSVSAGEEEPLERYQTANAGLHYLLWRNVRLMGEAGYDIERERTGFTLGTVLAF